MCYFFFFFSIWYVPHASSFPHGYFCDWLKIPKITLIKNVLLEASLAKFFLLCVQSEDGILTIIPYLASTLKTRDEQQCLQPNTGGSGKDGSGHFVFMLLLLCNISVVYEDLCIRTKINDVNYLVPTASTILFCFQFYMYTN